MKAKWMLRLIKDLRGPWRHALGDVLEQLRPKKLFCLVPVSDRPCPFVCDPNYFMSFKKKEKKEKLFFSLMQTIITFWYSTSSFCTRMSEFSRF